MKNFNLKIMMVSFFLLAGSSAFTKEKKNADFAIDSKEVFEKCSKGFSEFTTYISEQEEDLKKYIESSRKRKIKNEFNEHFENQDAVYEFLIFISPYLIPEERVGRAFYMDCWIELQDAFDLLKENGDKKEAELKLKRWSSCQKSAFKDQMPNDYLNYEKCFYSFVQ